MVEGDHSKRGGMEQGGDLFVEQISIVAAKEENHEL